MNGNLFTPQEFDKSSTLRLRPEGLTAQEAAIQQRVAKQRKIPLVSFGEARAESDSARAPLDGQVRVSTAGVEPQSSIVATAPKPGGGNAGWGIIIKLLILFVLVWIVFWFNYFGLIHLNQYLPWLPIANLTYQNTQTTNQTNTQQITQQITSQLPCPSIKEFCLNGQDVIKNGAYAGLGAKVASESAIYAVFDGDMTAIASIYPPELNREKIAAIYLDNKEQNLRAAYFFKGDAPVAKKVKAGEIIGKTGGELASYDNVSLLFHLIKGDPVKGERVKLSSQDFTY